MKKLLILMMISIICLLSACAKNENQTSDNPPASREAGDSSNAADKTVAVTEESANPPQNTSEPASSPSAAMSEATEPITNTEDQTPTFSSQEPETSTEVPTDPDPIPEKNLVILDDPYAEPLMPPPETKEVLRLPNEVFLYPALADDDAIHLRELDTGSGILEPRGFAALDETRFIILDNIGRYIKLYQDGKCVRSYFMDPDDCPNYIEIDEEYFYFVNYVEDLDTADDNMLYQVDLETGERRGIPFYEPDPERLQIDSMLWIDGQLTIFDFYSLKPDNTNSCLNPARDKVVPTEKGFQMDRLNGVVSSGTTTWVFDQKAFKFKRLFPIYIDRQDNLYAMIWDTKRLFKEGEHTLRKYSPQGELLWCLNVSDPDMIRHCPHAVKYCRDGKIYFMIIWEKETVIYQVQEEID